MRAVADAACRGARAGKGTKRKGRPKGRENPKPAKRPAAPPRSVGVVAPGQQCTQCGTQVWPPHCGSAFVWFYTLAALAAPGLQCASASR